MGVTRSKQDWSIGNWVNVGFLKLKILELIPTPGDWAPDEYILENAKGVRYSFVPHNGLNRLEEN